MLPVHGWIARGWEAVRESFASNVACGDDVGAACAVYRDGEPVTDPWARMRFDLAGDRRSRQLVAATYRSLGAR